MNDSETKPFWFRCLRWSSLGVGLCWFLFLLLLAAGWIAREPGPATPTNPCPSCPGDVFLDFAYGSFIAAGLLLAIATATMRYVWRDGPASVRLASTLLLVGTVLVGVYGLGILLLVPASLILAFGASEVPWLPRIPLFAIAAGPAGTAPLLLVGSTAEGATELTVNSLAFMAALLFGLGWIGFALSVPAVDEPIR